MYTKDQMFEIFLEGRKSANLAFPHSLYEEFESVLLAEEIKAVEQPLQTDACNCEQNHGVTVTVNNPNVCRVCRKPRR